jgi:hypothetical protein
MKRPLGWTRRLLIIVGLLVIGQYLALIWLAPRYVLRAVQRLAGGAMTARAAQLSFPLTTTLSGLQLTHPTPQAAFAIQRLTITPQWFSIPHRTVWVDRLEVEHGLLRLSRTPEGVFLWPRFPGGEALRTDELAWHLSAWRMHVDALQLTDGIIELVDERPPVPFHGAPDHLSLVAGPLAIPLEGAARMSFALRGRFVGSAGWAAPFSCSGWVDIGRRDLQCSCTVESIALAAFEPYFHGPKRVRMSQGDLALTTHWSATDNDLRARIQLEVGHLQEGTITINGRTVLMFKELLSGPEARLLGEITLAGPLDDPPRWHGTFLPGNDAMQRLIGWWLDRGVEMIGLPLWGATIPVSLLPANQAAMTEIQATRTAIREALEILTLPMPEQTPAPPPPPAPPTDAITSSP